MRSLVIMMVLAMGATASAQSPNVTAGDVGLDLTPGERVIVSGRVSCREALGLAPESLSADAVARCTVRGRVTLWPDRLVVDGRVPYTFRLDAVERIERPRDRIWNGAAIGYAAGFAPFALMELQCRERAGCWEGLSLVIGTIITGPIGFGIGALTDFLINRPRVAYSKTEHPPTVSVGAILTPRARGMGVAVAF